MGAGGISNLAQDCHYMLEIPDHLSMEDAATVLVVYSTVMFGLIHVTFILFLFILQFITTSINI